MTFQELNKLIFNCSISELEEKRAKGVDFTITDKINDSSLLISHCNFEYDLHYTQVELIDFLIKSGIDVNHQRNGRGGNLSALHMAVANSNLEVVKCLLAHGAQVEVKNKNGNTPLWNIVQDYKAKEFQLEIIKLLISNGASLDTKNNSGNSPRDIIISRGENIDSGLNDKDRDLRFLFT